MFTLQNFRSFLRYINFCGISYEILRTIAIYLKHTHYPKGSYIYKMHQRSNKFFGVIKGTISIRVKAKAISRNLSRNSSFKFDEEEKSISIHTVPKGD